MHILVFFSLCILILIRLIGLGVSTDFYLSGRTARFKFQILGWISWLVAGIFPILSENTKDMFLSNLFLVINAIFASFGAFFFMIGFSLYFRQISVRVAGFFSLIILIIPSLLSLLNQFDLAISFSSIVFSFLLLYLILFWLLEREKFSQILIRSKNWFYALLGSAILELMIILLISFQGLSYGLYQTDNLMMIFLNYSVGIGLTILLMVFLIHLEFSLSYRHRYELKDKYSHNVANIIQMIYSTTELVRKTDSLSVEDLSNLDTITQKCETASDLIEEIRRL
ncbi:MAG: hypothetical protein ACFFAJ_15020 [Candidatus Hodarchaeota archaeon]